MKRKKKKKKRKREPEGSKPPKNNIFRSLVEIIHYPISIPSEKKSKTSGVLILTVIIIAISYLGFNSQHFTLLLMKNFKDLTIFNLISSIFIHANPAHLFGNLQFFIFFAPAVERKLGTKKFLLLFVSGNIVGAFLTYYFGHYRGYSLGASASIAAIISYFVLSNFKENVNAFNTVKEIPGEFFSLLLIYHFLFDFILASLNIHTGVGHWAHIGGYLTGLFFWLINDGTPEKSSASLPEISKGLLDYFLIGFLPPIYWFMKKNYLFGFLLCFLVVKNFFFASGISIIFYIFNFYKNRE